MRRSSASATLVLAATAALMLGLNCQKYAKLDVPGDPILSGDLHDVASLELIELAPDAPLVEPGPDGKFGSEDDIIRWWWSGDVDLVLRTGATEVVGPIPDPSGLTGPLPSGLAEPFGEGVGIDFVVVPSDGGAPAPYGSQISPPYFEGLPVLVAAFADLDGDGYVGITHLDGNVEDTSIEEAELIPVARRFALGAQDAAAGRLEIGAGGPFGARLNVLLTAAAFAGTTDLGFFGGSVPLGPAIMTRLPFPPETNPAKILEGGPNGPDPASVDRPAGVEITPLFDPDPADPRIAERYTLATDGSDATIDGAAISSGGFSRFGLVRVPDPTQYAALPSRPLRPGLDAGGARTVYEVLSWLMLPDDGAGPALIVRVVPLDRLGNVADLAAPQTVTVLASGSVRIASPDLDGDPSRESIDVTDARGTALSLDDAGGAFDDSNAGLLLVEGGGGLLRLSVTLPDPDVDDSGLVDAVDAGLVASAVGFRHGEAGFDVELDLTGDGEIDERDVDLVTESLGQPVPFP